MTFNSFKGKNISGGPRFYKDISHDNTLQYSMPNEGRDLDYVTQCTDNLCIQILWEPFQGMWSLNKYMIQSNCVCSCRICLLHAHYCTRTNNSKNMTNNVSSTDFLYKVTNDTNNKIPLCFSSRTIPDEQEVQIGPISAISEVIEAREMQQLDIPCQLIQVSSGGPQLSQNVLFTSQTSTPPTPVENSSESLLQFDILPFFEEDIGPQGIYCDQRTESSDATDTIVANIIPPADDDTLIKFTASLTGAKNSANALTFIDTGSQECILGPSVLGALTSEDYTEEKKIHLTGPDGEDVAVWKRVTFKPHAGIQIGNNKPISFTASVLYQNSKHYDILLAMNMLRKMGPVNMVISDQATIVQFHGLKKMNGENTSAIVNCHHPSSTSSRLVSNITLQPLEEKEIKILSFTPELFLPIQPEKLPMVGTQRNFFTDPNGKCLKFTGTSKIKIINNSNQPLNLRKGQSVALALNQRKTFVTSRNKFNCPIQQCNCNNHHEDQKQKEKLENV